MTTQTPFVAELVEATVRHNDYQRIGVLALLRSVAAVGSDEHLLFWAPTVELTETEREVLMSGLVSVVLLRDEIDGAVMLDVASIATCTASDPETLSVVTSVGEHLFTLLQDATAMAAAISAALPHPAQSTATDDVTFSVLETFSKVTKLYASVGRALFGMTEPPRQRHNEVASNPWLVERALALPPSEPECPAEIDLELPVEELCRLLHSRGSLPHQRRALWSRVFGTNVLDIAPHALELAVEDSITKDVLRTDRTEPFFHPEAEGSPAARLPRLSALKDVLLAYASRNPEIGYLQGMHELAATALYVSQGDATECSAFFNAIMGHQSKYCLSDGLYMHASLKKLSALLSVLDPVLHDRLSFSSDNARLLFAVRWLLLLFRRDLCTTSSAFIEDGVPADDPASMDPEDFQSHYASTTLNAHARVIEAVLCAPVPQYEVIIAAAMLLHHRAEVLAVAHRFDLVLSYFSNRARQPDDTNQVLNLASRILAHIHAMPLISADPDLRSFAR